jgi:hypothetical protein
MRSRTWGTDFKGVPTITGCAIGTAIGELSDPVAGALMLL